jgi:hypothetical protein
MCRAFIRDDQCASLSLPGRLCFEDRQGLRPVPGWPHSLPARISPGDHPLPPVCRGGPPTVRKVPRRETPVPKFFAKFARTADAAILPPRYDAWRTAGATAVRRRAVKEHRFGTRCGAAGRGAPLSFDRQSETASRSFYQIYWPYRGVYTRL